MAEPKKDTPVVVRFSKEESMILTAAVARSEFDNRSEYVRWHVMKQAQADVLDGAVR